MTYEFFLTARELDARTSDGLEVTLLWSPDEDCVLVTVFDASRGETYFVPVKDHAEARKAFKHPFAYGVENHPSVGRGRRVAAQ